jgi:hypothetical protein
MAVDIRATGACDWKRAHEQLVRLAKSRAGLELEEGKWLLAAQRAGTHQHLGYGSVLEYAEWLFGHAPRLTHEKLRVAGALERLPELEQALSAGELTWSAVRALTRVATPETERVASQPDQGALDTATRRRARRSARERGARLPSLLLRRRDARHRFTTRQKVRVERVK